MTLELKGVSKMVEGQTHIYPTDLTLTKGTMNVLLGPTSSGKTSLMRLMAGSSGKARMSPASACRTGKLPWSTSSSSTTRR